ncbi:hypothetical protein TL16_g01007 [Triparma laevis f. inornata]|uniref:Tryptophan synthase beta chain-like PALP domain-containing protein n=1 Tax=Triparma laevis f. inornata TaxID=1714386 RepID=A0A9W7DRA6_9STRA|nr:hypothetical protein TL16_g01007 [Triparma laevis f. inornata]
MSRLPLKLGLPAGSLVAKLENLNPGGSKKDRVAKQIIEDALSDGTLKPGQGVIELTSGNTGTGLSIVCAGMGHKFTAVMSEGNTPERALMMKRLGARVILVKQHPDSVVGQVSGIDLDLVEEECARVVEEEGLFRADQFKLSGSWRCHYLNTGPELWKDSEGSIDGFVDFVGSGGTFIEVSAYLKEQSGGKVKSFLVEPATSTVMNPAGRKDGGHKIQGGGYSKGFDDLPVFEDCEKNLGMGRDDLIDGFLTVTDEMAIEHARLLASEEGIFGGFSAGANLASAVEVLKRGEAKRVAFVVCDTGLKYMSTDLW